MTLPLRVCGRCWSNVDLARARRRRGGGVRRRAAVAQLVVRRVAAAQRDERLDQLAGHRVGLADHAGLGHRRVLHQRALDLERPDQVPGRLDHVVGAADEPEVAVVVHAGPGRR